MNRTVFRVALGVLFAFSLLFAGVFAGAQWLGEDQLEVPYEVKSPMQIISEVDGVNGPAVLEGTELLELEPAEVCNRTGDLLPILFRNLWERVDDNSTPVQDRLAIVSDVFAFSVPEGCNFIGASTQLPTEISDEPGHWRFVATVEYAIDDVPGRHTAFSESFEVVPAG